MLIVNGTVLNIGQPVTELEKRIKRQMAEIKEEFGLSSGKSINFVYPKEYLKVNKANGGKIDKPSSFKITFRDFFGDGNGSSEYRWCNGIQSPDGRAAQYFPKFHIFTGNWTLTEKDIDLIWYLLYVYSRTKDGKNIAANARPYIAIEDKVRDANAVIALRRKRAFIESALLNSQEDGGLSEEKLRELAMGMFIVGADKRDPSLLRSELLDIVDTQRGGYDLIKAAFDDQKSGSGIYKALTQKLIDNGIITDITKGTLTAYYYVDADGQPGSKIVNIKKNEPHAAQFALFLERDLEVVDILTNVLETKLAAKDE